MAKGKLSYSAIGKMETAVKALEDMRRSRIPAVLGLKVATWIETIKKEIKNNGNISSVINS